jgi:TDG/mug DNA glycosylase family protein
LKPVLVQSFPPVADRHAEILILGSMPGRDSLAAGQYYAHPYNLFWKIMAAMLGFKPQTPYRGRLKALRDARIALWDVMHSCRRVGSLDASIETSTIKANDFPSFFRSHRRIGHVFFNGSTAQATYVRHVLPSVAPLGLRYTRLPSTSPAHAALSYQQKLAAWRTVLKPVARSMEVSHDDS